MENPINAIQKKIKEKKERKAKEIEELKQEQNKPTGTVESDTELQGQQEPDQEKFIPSEALICNFLYAILQEEQKQTVLLENLLKE